MKTIQLLNGLRLLRNHLFVFVTLMGCLAPWVTPRHFPSHSIPEKTFYKLSVDIQR